MIKLGRATAVCTLVIGLAGCVGGGGVRDGGSIALTSAQIDEAERSKLPTKTAIAQYRSYDDEIASDARLLHVTTFATGQHKGDADPVGSPIMRTLDVANLAAWALNSPFQVEAPSMALLGMGLRTTDERIKTGYENGRRLLNKPSLTLIGYQSAARAKVGTDAYGAIMDGLFAKGDSLIRSADLGCEPAAKHLHSRTLRGDLISTHNGSKWFPNVQRVRGYTCSKIADNAMDERNMDFVIVRPSPQPSDAVIQSFGIMGMTGTVTVQDDPIVEVTFKDLSKYPSYPGNDAAWMLLEKLQDEMPVGWYFVIGGALPGDTSAQMHIIVGQKTPEGFSVARYSK